MARGLTIAVLVLAVVACTSIGPGTVSRDRIDYASSIGNSWKEQTLLNIVKLRYGDMPIFLEVAQVIAGYQLQGTLGTSFTAGNFNAAVIGPFTANGNATTAGTYTDRPTVIYQPTIFRDILAALFGRLRVVKGQSPHDGCGAAHNQHSETPRPSDRDPL
jgi:hypothetical protein